MDISSWLKGATERLEKCNIGTARLDCLVLLEDETGKDRGWLLAHPEHELAVSQFKKLDGKITRRTKHEPLAYIRGMTEFYKRKFIVNRYVLEPRPESETMIELFKKLEIPKSAVVIDVGTGSGALGITAKMETPGVKVTLIDIDRNCLAVAGKNSGLRAVEVELVQSDLLKSCEVEADVLLCNLPYVPEDWHINEAAMHEPKLAMFGGKDGLDVYRELFKQLGERDLRPKFILTESLPPQHKTLAHIAQDSGYKQLQSDDFIQVFG